MGREWGDTKKAIEGRERESRNGQNVHLYWSGSEHTREREIVAERERNSVEETKCSGTMLGDEDARLKSGFDQKT